MHFVYSRLGTSKHRLSDDFFTLSIMEMKMQTSDVFEFIPIVVSIYLLLIPKILSKYGESRITSQFQRLNLDSNVIKLVVNVAFDWDKFIGYLGAMISLLVGSILLLIPSGLKLFQWQKLLCLLISFVFFFVILKLFSLMEKNYPLSRKLKCLGLTYANSIDLTLWISNIVLGILTYLNIISRR